LSLSPQQLVCLQLQLWLSEQLWQLNFVPWQLLLLGPE